MTQPASSISSSTATLNGAVSPNGLPTTARFEWGTSNTLATFITTTSQSIAAGNAAVAVNASLTGLVAGTTYYYRVTASNGAGTSNGSILSFVAGDGSGVARFTSFVDVSGAQSDVHNLRVDSTGNVYILAPYGTGLAVFKSTDGGSSFPAPVGIANSSFRNSEYELAVDGNNVVHVVWDKSGESGADVYYSRSTDGGTTFTNPVTVRTGNMYSGYSTGNAIEPRVASDGLGNVYIAYSSGTDDSSGVFVGYDVWVSKSVNGGTSFQPEFFIRTPNANQDTARRIYATPSNFYILLEDQTAADLYFHRGSAGSVLNNATRINPTAGRVSPGGDIAIDPSGTLIYAVFADRTIDGQGDLILCKSMDSGASWGNCVPVSDSTYRDQVFPSIALDAFGTLHAVWTDRRSAAKYQTFYAYSTNGGSSFSTNPNISAEQPGSDFTQAHLAVDTARSLLYVSSSKDFGQLVLSKGSFGPSLRKRRGQLTSQ